MKEPVSVNPASVQHSTPQTRPLTWIAQQKREHEAAAARSLVVGAPITRWVLRDERWALDHPHLLPVAVGLLRPALAPEAHGERRREGVALHVLFGCDVEQRTSRERETAARGECTTGDAERRIAEAVQLARQLLVWQVVGAVGVVRCGAVRCGGCGSKSRSPFRAA